ncbi:MAG: PAS domain S-box protein, partial [Bacteroidota bacterium]
MTLAKDYIESFSTMFEGLSQAAIYVANDGRLLAVNSSAALLFSMQREELTGQYWAGLDAQLTQIHWLKRWKDIQQKKLVRYETDILTSKQYLRPITVNITLADDEGAMLMLTDKVSEDIKAGELSLVEESMDVGTWSYNRIDGRFRLSAASRRLLGIPSEMIDTQEIITGISERMGPEELTQLRRLAEDLLTDAGRGKHTLYITNGTGTSRLNVVAHSVGNDLHVTHIYGIVREEKEQSPTFSEGVTAGGFSNNLARFTIDQTNDLIFWTGPGAEVFYVNKTVERALGYGSDELRDMSVFDFVHDFGQEEIDQLWEVLRREQNVEAEYDLYRKDGSKINILASVNYLKYNGQEYACSFCRDNTLRLQREKRRRLSEFTIDAAGEMILWSKAGGTLTFANKTLLEFTGYTSEEFANLRADDFSPDKKREDFVRYWNRIRQGEVVKYETVIRKKDGTLVPVRASLNYLQ